MRRLFTISFCFAVGGAMIVAVLVQRNHLAEFKMEHSRLLAQLTHSAAGSPPVAQAKPQRPTPVSSSPSIELLKLRADVARLSNRKRELANAALENANLQTQLASRGTNAPGAVTLPPGYIKKSEARFMGYASPEATMQSLLWAIQNQDTARFLQAFDSVEAKKLEARIQSLSSPAEFFKGAEALPGMHILGKEVGPDGEVVLKIEVEPGVQGPEGGIRLRQFDGQWKLVEGF